MKLGMYAALGASAAALLLANGAAAATVFQSAPFQGATFTVTEVSGTEFTFDISIPTTLTGNWSTATYLGAFSFSGIMGTSTASTATETIPGSATAITVPGGLNAGGCDGNSASTTCYNWDPNIPITGVHDLRFDIVSTAGAFDFSGSLPHLKIDWTASSTDDTHVGDLYSQDIGPGGGVPEPATWTMMILGAGMIGGVLRKRRQMALAPI